jgi:hypothetical protein
MDHIERGTLRDYQIDDLAFFINNPRSANLSDPGTGKTPTADAWMSYLWNDLGVRTYWVMPKSLLGKNRLELLKFSTFEEEDVIIVDGTPTQRFAQMSSDAKVFLMGFSRFRDDWDTLYGLHPDMGAVCVDEIHKGFGGHNSGQTQALYRAMRVMQYFQPMTGTLINGRLSSAFPTIHIICPDYYASYQSFIKQHAIEDWYGTIIGWKGHDKIRAILDTHCVRRSFESVYGKEAKEIQIELVPMSAKQRAAYDEFEKTAMLELEDEFLDGGMPGVAAIRCRQIMAHPERIPTPSGLFVDLTDGEKTGKDERLELHLEDHLNTGKPFIIFASLVPEQERIVKLCEKMGLKVGMINGSVPTKKRIKIDEDFIAGKLQGVVGSGATADVGYNWGHVDHVIAVSIDYQDSSFIQGYRRAIRGKRETPLRITVLEYEKSIDQRIFVIVQRKSENANKVDDTYQKLELMRAV